MLNPSVRKAALALAHDAAIAAISFVVALYLRLGEDFSQSDPYRLPGLGLFTLCAALVFLLMRTYRRSWRYTSTQDLLALTKAATYSILLFLPVMFLYNRLEHMPRSLMFINWFVLLALLGGPRFLYRMLRERTVRFSTAVPERQRITVLLAGVNNYSEPFLRDTVDNPRSNYTITGILDNKAGRQGQTIHGVRVLGRVDQAMEVIKLLKAKRRQPRKILITPDLFSPEEFKALLAVADRFGMTMERLPRLTDFRGMEEAKVTMRPILLEDLLGRPQKALDRAGMRALVNGKRVLVTGAGGSIGGELVRQIASYGPARLTLLDNSEFNSYIIDGELERVFPGVARRAVVGDIRDADLLESLMESEKPELVFHAAAIKHVPLSETNICEAVLTNIVGTKLLAEACAKAGVTAMVTISTDKAVNPTNVMGATKRFAERYVQSFGESKHARHTRFVTIRFGNVLGSAGSVIPLFRQQIAAGGPVTVTHRDITRYFMTIREAVELVLQAASVASSSSSEGSRIYVLDMGTPVKITELAEQVIRLAGFTPHEDIKIEYTGLRSGEKLFEELFYPEENPKPTALEGVLLASATENHFSTLEKAVKKLEAAARARDDAEVLELLKKAMPEFRHQN